MTLKGTIIVQLICIGDLYKLGNVNKTTYCDTF